VDEAREHGPVRELTTLHLVVALGVGLAFIQLVGLGALLSSRLGYAARLAALFPNPLVKLVFLAFVIGLTLTTLLAAVTRARVQRDVLFRSLVLLLGVVVCTIANPISSPRYIVGTVLIAILLTVGAMRTAWRRRMYYVGFVAFMVFAFPMADYFRYASYGGSHETFIDSLTSSDFDSFVQILNTLAFVSEHGITYGFQALGVLLFFVPSRFWPGKPLDTGAVLGEFRGYHSTNLSAPIPAEFYINGGLILVVLGMVAFGYLTARIDSQIADRVAVVGGPGVMGALLPGYMMILMRGSLLQAMAYLTMFALCASILHMTSRRHTSGSRDVPRGRGWGCDLPLRLGRRGRGSRGDDPRC
jgi:hypothetical protein